MNKENILLLTGSIDIKHINTPFTQITNLSERLNQYTSNIKRIILHANFNKIIFCENTDYRYDYSELIKLAEIHTKQLEILSFKGDEEKIALLGKGYGEGEIINYAINNSSFLKDEGKSFYKLTGRVYIKNINTILKRDRNKPTIFMKSSKDAREAVDTVFFKIKVHDYLTCLSEAFKNVNDRKKNYLEHVYYNALINCDVSKIYNFSVIPDIDGISASNKQPYNISAIDYLKKSIKLKAGKYRVKPLNDSCKSTLIYEPYGTGHRTEYIRNILNCIQEVSQANQYIFALPQYVIDQLKADYPLTNVTYVAVDGRNASNIFSTSLLHYNNILELYKRFKFDRVLVIDYYPLTLAAILKNPPFNISGILYKPFDPTAKNKLLFSINKRIQYYFTGKRKKIKSIFILNNPELTKELNLKFRTGKFRNLTDPVPFYAPNNVNPYPPKPDVITGLHFGSMDKRKGTSVIFEAIPLIPFELRKMLQLAFVGKPAEDYKEILKGHIEKTKELFPEVTIIYHPEFVTNNEMEDYYQFADFVLLPYQFPNMSSGVLGHATKWNKYLIGNKGVVGYLINEYNLGEAIKPIADNLAAAIIRYIKQRPVVAKANAERYLRDHSVEEFFKVLFN